MPNETRGSTERPLHKDRWRDLFEQCDTDHDNHISFNELKNMVDSMENRSKIPTHVLNTVYQNADRNGDGRIAYNEFVYMMEHPDNHLLFGVHIERASRRYVEFLVPKRYDRRGVTEIDGQYEDEYKCCPPPFGMVLISLIEVILFILDEANSSKYGDGPVATALMLDPSRRREVWRFLTYMFVHIGYTHLIVNLAVQLMLGIPLEMVHKWWRVLLVYFAGVVAGSLATTVTDPSVRLAGASGGVYSLITAHIATIIMNWKEMTMPIVQLLIFLIITIIDTATAIYNRYYLDINDHIGYVAHFAGAMAGLLVGILVLRNLEVTKKERLCKWFSLALYIMLMGSAIIVNIAVPEYFLPEKYDMPSKNV